MESPPIPTKPTKQERLEARASYDALSGALRSLRTASPEIEIAETGERVVVPKVALELLAELLKQLGEGRPVAVVPTQAEITTQVAADLIGCSRPHLVKLLEAGEIAFTKVGRHRRVRYDDVLRYKAEQKRKQLALLREIMQADESSGVYST